jgi:glutaminyl-tRNA synthetase
LVIDNYPEGKNEFVEVANNPEDPSAGTRGVPFSRELYIEQEDFREVPPPKYYRLSPSKEVRLRNAYFVTAQNVVKDAKGEVAEVHCTYDPLSRGGNSPDGRKVKSTIHWVSSAHAISAETRLYDKLFTKADPYDVGEGEDVLSNLNPNSLEILTGAKLEPSLAGAKPGDRFQFERVGYFCVDRDSAAGKPVFNRTLSLKDSWAKIEKKAGA